MIETYETADSFEEARKLQFETDAANFQKLFAQKENQLGDGFSSVSSSSARGARVGQAPTRAGGAQRPERAARDPAGRTVAAARRYVGREQGRGKRPAVSVGRRLPPQGGAEVKHGRHPATPPLLRGCPLP
jgi:hypothetical protein